jgi:hypothetical protein
VELLCLIAVLAVLAAVVIPNVIRARNMRRPSACSDANLWAIHYAKQLWATENRKGPAAVPTEADLVPYLRSSQWPSCPALGTYTIGAVAAYPTCSHGAVQGHTLKPSFEPKTRRLLEEMKKRRAR